MEMRKIKSERVTEERKHEDEIIKTILLTAGAALLMACLKRAMVSSLVEQWRAWVFLILNLVLLAILLTSIRSASNESQECNNDGRMKIERTKSGRLGTWSEQVEEHKDCQETYRKRSQGNEPERVEDRAEVNPLGLSKEELNERVETFIATFRQHLATDAKKCRSQFLDNPERARSLNVRPVSHLTVCT